MDYVPISLIGLWLLWAVLLFGGMAAGRGSPGRSRQLVTWTRIGSSAALCGAAWAWLSVAGADNRLTVLLVAIGMSFGLLGDLFMASLLPVAQPVLGGMAAFAIGHVAYCAAFLAVSAPSLLGVAAWVVWLTVGTVGWRATAFRPRLMGTLRWAALPYSLLLASTAGLASGLAITTASMLPLAIGGALFLVSDLLIAARLFRGLRRPWLDDLIWLTYGPAQMLIVYGVSLYGTATLVSLAQSQALDYRHRHQEK